jgi:peptide chain release factor 2
MADPGFWNAQERARGVVQEVKVLKNWIEPWDRLDGRVAGALELAELLTLEPDAEMAAELTRESTAIVTTSATRRSRLARGPVALRPRTGHRC